MLLPRGCQPGPVLTGFVVVSPKIKIKVPPFTAKSASVSICVAQAPRSNEPLHSTRNTKQSQFLIPVSGLSLKTLVKRRIGAGAEWCVLTD